MYSQAPEIVAKARMIAERIAASEGLELVDVEWRGGRRGVLRIYIDKPGGVTHGDCERVSKQASTILDVEDVVPGGAYVLEVSSPGLDRKLLKPEDYVRFAGKKAKVRLKTPIEGRRHVSGRLCGVEGEEIALETDKHETVRFRFDQVQSARLMIEL